MSVEPGKWGVIYNPKAGTRKVQKRWKEIKEYMDSKGVNYDYVQSEGFGSVERLAKILANNGYRTIVIVGGDGALNDAINGIMLSDAEDKENIALVYFVLLSARFDYCKHEKHLSFLMTR